MPSPFERLENRVLLAVNVSRYGSTLLVEYDDAGDLDLTLTGTAPGAITVANADTGNDSYTGIKHIKIVGRGGNDQVQLTDIQIAGNITADMKGGRDFINVEGVHTDIGGNFKAKMGDGNDDLEIDGAGADGPIRIRKSVTVDFGNAEAVGGDYFELIGLKPTDLVTVGGGVTIKGGNGEQELYFDCANIGKNLKVDLGAGNDIVRVGSLMNDPASSFIVQKNATFKTGDGDDQIIMGTSVGLVDFRKNLTIDLGNADVTDILDVDFTNAANDQFHVGGSVSIKGQAGAQEIFIDGVTIDGNVKISLGDGDDLIEVSQDGGDINSTIGRNLDVKMGSGENDELFAERLTVNRRTKIDGGAGGSDKADETAGGNLVFGSPPTSTNFETGSLA